MPRGASWWHLTADALLCVLAFLAAHALRFSTGLIPAPLGEIALSDWLRLALYSLPLWLFILALHGLYYSRLKQAFSAELGALTHALAEGLLATILLTFTFRGLPDSRLALVIAFALAWLYLVAYRALLRLFRHRRPRAAIIGESELAAYLRRQFAGRATRFDLAGAYPSVADWEACGEDAVFCDTAQASELFRALAGGPPAAAVYLLPEGVSSLGAAMSVAVVEGVPTFSFKSAADLAVMRSVKRSADLLFGTMLLALTSPLWLFCALGIKLSMPGPVFFRHERLGADRRRFHALKFRSMKHGAVLTAEQQAQFAAGFKLADDPRITPFGRLLRKASLDELPQLINILRGDLSLVGPRAIVPDELEKYGRWGALLLSVPPGLTGLWQVSGRSATTYEQRVDYDLYYINNWSLGLDLLILLRTIPAVLSRRGAV